MFKYDENYLIAISINEYKNNLLIFKIEGNNLVKSCEIKTKFKFEEKYGRNGYTVRGYNNKILFVLKDKRIILLCHEKIYVLALGIN